MKQVNDKLDFDVDTPSDAELKKKFETEVKKQREELMKHHQKALDELSEKGRRKPTLSKLYKLKEVKQ